MVSPQPADPQVSSRIIINDWERTLRAGFQPSRLRHHPAILNTTSAGGQRSGTSLPIFSPRGLAPAQALELARHIDPFGRPIDLTLSNSDRSNFRRVTHEPKTAKKGRHLVIRELVKLAETPKPLQTRLQGVLHKSAQANLLQIPLIAFLVEKLNYPDTSLPMDLTRE